MTSPALLQLVQRAVDLIQQSAPLIVPGRILNELCSHAVETQPEECCGLVTGTETERFLSVYRCRNEMSARHRTDPKTFPRDGKRAFLMNEELEAINRWLAKQSLETHSDSMSEVVGYLDGQVARPALV